MDNNTETNARSGTGMPTPTSEDANATRYFPPQQPYSSSPAGISAPEQPGYNAPYTPAPVAQYPPQQPYNAPQPPGYSVPYGPPPIAPQPQPPQQPWPGMPPQAGHRERDRTVLGLILIGGGALFLLDQFSPFTSFGDLVPLLLGAIFMYAYFTTRPGYRIGFLIPGAILLGVGAGQVLSDLPFMPFFGYADFHALPLGLGFCLIWFFERKHWWALIPGGILVLSGLSTLALVGSLWPLVLIALGAYLLFDQSRRQQKR